MACSRRLRHAEQRNEPPARCRRTRLGALQAFVVTPAGIWAGRASDKDPGVFRGDRYPPRRLGLLVSQADRRGGQARSTGRPAVMSAASWCSIAAGRRNPSGVRA